MVDFKKARTELSQARAARRAAQAAVAQALAAQKEISRRRASLARRFKADNRKVQAEGDRLTALAKNAEQTVAARKTDLQHSYEALRQTLATFTAHTDPRSGVFELSDQWPFLLVPVRIETRFMDVGTADAPKPQLWVRIYPDDCSIDTYEPMLSTTELGSAQRYWRQLWRAGGVESDVRAAWRGLVTAHGSGRAGWIVDHYQPVNLGQEPAKNLPSDVILVIPTQTPLPAIEAAATLTYWKAFWLADDDSFRVQAAYDALVAAVGGKPRADEIIGAYQPYNLSDAPAPPAKKTDVTVSTAVVIFPPDPTTTQDPWTQAPRVNHLADRFIVIGYSGGSKVIEAIGNVISLPLIVGPDPSAQPSAGIHPDNGDLFVPNELKWMVDFDSAVQLGMGLRIDLTPEQAASGFDRLLVLGLEVSSSEIDGGAALTELLKHHHFGRSGLALLPQGTTTHNSTGSGSGFTSVDDPDASFADRKQAQLFDLTDDFKRKRDGQWLAELLGIEPSCFYQVHGAGGTDQMEGSAMQRALWPATLGYWMDKMMTPVFDDDSVENTRWFFTNYASGRGALPSIRIGAQPYGILPTTAFSRIRWLDQTPQDLAHSPDAQLVFLGKLYRVLRTLDADWTTMSQGASFVGKAGDAHQTLLDILGLHPASVEFHSRYAESLNELFNLVNFWGQGPDFWQAVQALSLNAAAKNLLSRLGYSANQQPDILGKVFFAAAAQLQNVIDDRPVSETAKVRPYTDDGRNYIRWLIDAAKTSLDALNQEQGFSNAQTPQTILYLMLRHSLLLAYYDSSYALHKSGNILTPQQLLATKPEATFVHVDATAGSSESRWAILYKTEPRITNDPRLTVADYISQNIGQLLETNALGDQLDALDVLATATTASLERTFAEHIDCCCYRYDAWLLGLVNFQLRKMRYLQREEGVEVRPGIYLGAYAWVEDLRPSKTVLEPAQLSPDLAKVFGGSSPIMSDPANGGYIHAPSLPHANTAAVLRSGYLANATATNPGSMAINLSSDRVRLALSVLEGIRNGQSLGALLGYRFERGLHDEHNLAEVDKFIYPLRKAFPLVADQMSSTKTAPGVPIEVIEARNVLDGLKLRDYVTKNNLQSYPFGLSLPTATAAEATAINTEVNALLDVYDAIADLALAEGVHQAVQGNFDRVAGTLETYTTGNYPPDPTVVQTPPSGIGLTHRVALHLKPGLAAPPNSTPRSSAEPALDAWLADVLPPLDGIGCKVTWNDPVTKQLNQPPVTMKDLGLRPVDLLYLVKPDQIQSMTELDDRIIRFVIGKFKPRPDAVLQIRYMTPGAVGQVSVFEVSALLRSLRTLVTHARPLRASDATPHGAASPEQDAKVSVDPTRISNPKGDLDTLRDDINTYLGTLQPLVKDPVANRAAIVAGIDDFMNEAVDLLERAARFNIPQSGWGFVYAWKQTQFSARPTRVEDQGVLTRVQDLVTRWDAKLTDYNARIAAYHALPPGTSDDDRFAMLRRAELIISTALIPLPASPAALRTALNGKRDAFVARRDQFRAVLTTGETSFSNLLALVRGLLPISDFDAQTIDLTPFENRALTLAADLSTNLQGHLNAIKNQSTQVQTLLDTASASWSPSAKVQALQAAAQALLGDDFRIIPEFSLSDVQGSEWENALGASTGGTLLDYVKNTAKIDFPVDEWLYGAARVRPSLRAWEQTLMFSGAFGSTQSPLVPIQLPFDPNAPWVAMQFPATYVLDGDRLLYTAYYATPFDKTAKQCGLLVDEWTEVIPSSNRTTGITFNSNRPDNEAPQTMLLVTPAVANGFWAYQDLIGALNETLDLAKKRAVEPVHIDNSAYAPLLPATVMASMFNGISIATCLAAANGVFVRIGSQAHG